MATKKEFAKSMETTIREKDISLSRRDSKDVII
jgi:hypothetical protein